MLKYKTSYEHHHSNMLPNDHNGGLQDDPLDDLHREPKITTTTPSIRESTPEGVDVVGVGKVGQSFHLVHFGALPHPHVSTAQPSP
jgi:hypothetical protein